MQVMKKDAFPLYVKVSLESDGQIKREKEKGQYSFIYYANKKIHIYHVYFIYHMIW